MGGVQAHTLDPGAHQPRPRGRHPHRGQTNTCENITLPQTSFAGGTNQGVNNHFGGSVSPGVNFALRWLNSASLKLDLILMIFFTSN